MGFKLRREIRAALPPGLLTSAERLLVLELADLCNDTTREGFPGAALLAEVTDLSPRSVQEVLARVAKKWVELRVPLGKSDTGKPYYSHAGRRTTFRFPPVRPFQGATDPGSSGAINPGPSEPEGATDPGGRCDGSVQKVRQIRGPSPQLTPQKDNTSSLSPQRPDDRAISATAEADEREREDDVEEELSPANAPARRIIAEHCGITDEPLAEQIIGYVESGNNVRSAGFWVIAARNGTIHGLVAEQLAAITNPPPADAWAPQSPADHAVAQAMALAQKYDRLDGTGGAWYNAATGRMETRDPFQPTNHRSSSGYRPYRDPEDLTEYNRPL